MQRFSSILFALSLSVLIIYGGSGVNAYFYCCEDCRTQGHSAVTEHKCCEIHHHNHDGNAATQLIHDCHNECGVDRIQFHWQSSQGNQLQIQPTVIILNNSLSSCVIQDMASKSLIASLGYKHKRSQKPPDLSKEDYFSLLSTLII